MLDFNHILSTPGADIQYFVGYAGPTLIQWQTWRKPRGVKFIYLLGVGGGASGGTGVNTGTTSGGGQGGDSGAQTNLMIPAMMVPDVLYIQCGAGGPGPTTSGSTGNAGVPTYVTIEPDTTLTANMTLLFANGGTVGSTAATTTVGGTSGTPAAAAPIANMPLAGRGFYTFLAGQAGTTGGGANNVGVALTVPTTGLMVTGGAGGGGCNSGTGAAGGALSAPTGSLGQDFFPTIAGGLAAVTSIPAGAGVSGYIARNYLMNYGGAGGGGGTLTAGGFSGAGAPGAPGCGGGGSGGANTTNTALKAGDGGPGFVLIASW